MTAQWHCARCNKLFQTPQSNYQVGDDAPFIPGWQEVKRCAYCLSQHIHLTGPGCTEMAARELSMTFGYCDSDATGFK